MTKSTQFDWVDLATQLKLKCGVQILAPHLSCLSFLLFCFLLRHISSIITLFIFFLHLIFLHLTISSQPSFTRLPQYFLRSLCSWALLPHTHFWWNPFSNPSFLCTNMSSSNGSSFLTFYGKKYDPTFDWNDKEGLL